MDSAHQGVPQAPEPHRPHLVRRIMSVLSGAVALGLIVLLWGARDGMADDWDAGFGWLYVLQGLLVVAFGAGAVVLWHPRDHRGPWRRILLGALVAVIVVVGVLASFAAG